MLAHWDHVEWTRIDRGLLQGMRQRLGVEAGAARAGLSRYQMGPRERAMPVHVHADDEEFFYVLSGSGVSWQDGRTYAVVAGDCVVHRRGAETHTIVAGATGLDVLAFSSGSDTHLVWLPRANAWWMGPRWLPSDGPNPFELEAAAGELELPEPERLRPSTIVTTQDVAPEPMRHGGVDSHWRDLGVAAGSALSGMTHVEVTPGARSCPFHCHSAEEEIFVVLAGTGTLRLGGEHHAVRTGQVVARPPGTRVAHQFTAGDDGLTLLAWGTRDPNDIVWYPDSNKVNLRGVGSKLASSRSDIGMGKDEPPAPALCACATRRPSEPGARQSLGDVDDRVPPIAALDRPRLRPFADVPFSYLPRNNPRRRNGRAG